jgi:cell division protein FtsN
VSIKRDYKPKTTWQPRQRLRLRLHGLVVIMLVIVGLLGSLLAYLRSDTSTKTAPTEMTANPSEPEVAATQDSISPPKPKYDFYQLLPERKLTLPEDDSNQDTGQSTQPSVPPQQAISKSGSPVTSAPAESAIQPSPATASAETRTRYIVQAGSFRNHTDADRRKASIAFLGISARIETVRKDDGGALHRVRIGPINGTDKVKALRQRLQENNIQSIAIKTH